MAGRRPQPRSLKLLRGNPGKRPLRDNEPEPIPGRPVRPRGLTSAARAEWDRLAKLLESEKRLTLSDGPALQVAAVSFGEAKCCRRIRASIKEPELWLRLQTAERMSWAEYRKAVNDLCLSPGTRARASASRGEAEGDKLSAFLRRQHPGQAAG